LTSLRENIAASRVILSRASHKSPSQVSNFISNTTIKICRDIRRM
jgi:hypothetical protein